jgi:signal transduction histidine kinase
MSETTPSPLAEARAQLNELLTAARNGTIIPFRLPAQIEAIEALVAKAEAEAAKPATGGGADLDAFMKDQAAFMSHAIHELRTPMTSIRGYADMLNSPAMGTLNDMQKNFTDVIRTNARRMDGLLTDVSDISKLRGATLRVQPKMDMAKNVLLKLEKAVRPQAEETGRELTFSVPDGLPLLNLDSDLIHKVLVKLLENALRYTPAEGGKVSVTARGEDGWLVIEISDNGVGMTEDDLKQLGTLYFRADNEVVRSFKGSGMGIPIAYGILKLHDGLISVTSTPNVGTTFTLKLKGMS